MNNAFSDFAQQWLHQPVERRIAFPESEYQSRLQKLRTAMAENEFDVLLLTSPEAMCWLHGYESRWYKIGATTEWPPYAMSVVHVDHDEYFTIEDASHADLLHSTSVSTDNRFSPEETAPECFAFVRQQLKANGWNKGRIGLEFSSPIPNRAASQALEEILLQDAGVQVADATAVIRGVRKLKSPAELAHIRKAAQICDAGHQRLLEVISPDTTEIEAWGEMMLAMAKAGGEHAGIHEIVAARRTLFMGHAMSTTARFQEGPIYSDPSGVFRRYHANIARTYWLGNPPDEAYQMSEIVGDAFKLFTDIAVVGARFEDVGNVMKAYYQEHGIWDLRAWIGGYELGISFPPDWVGEFVFNAGEPSNDIIEHGLVTNYESVFGISMIDTIIYEDSGTTSLSKLPHRVSVI